MELWVCITILAALNDCKEIQNYSVTVEGRVMLLLAYLSNERHNPRPKHDLAKLDCRSNRADHMCEVWKVRFELVDV